MRNYCSVSDLKEPEFVQKIYDVFDDEFFLLLRRNSPQYIGVPYRFGKEFLETLGYSAREVTATQLQRREVLLSDESDWNERKAYVLIVGGSPRYCFFPYEQYLQDRIHKRMREVLHSEFLERHGIDRVIEPAYGNS